MHPTWKRHSTPLHSPLQCHRFFSSPLSYPFSLSLTLPSPSCLHLMSPVSCTTLSLSLLGFLVSFFENVPLLLHSAAVFSSSLCPHTYFFISVPFPPWPLLLFLSNLDPSILFSSLVCLPFSLLGLNHTYLGFCLAVHQYANRFLGDWRQSC